MLKSESIYRLESVGLNTPDYFISTHKGEVLHYLAKHEQELLSLRTERGKEFKCPFYYNMKGEHLWLIAKKLLEDGYKVMISPSIDTLGCEAFGAIGLGERNEDVIEVVFGEGKVRELDCHPNRKTLVVPKGKMTAITMNESGLVQSQIFILNTIWRKVKESLYDSIPCIVEWSWYNRGIGRKGTNDIYWEIRENY